MNRLHPRSGHTLIEILLALGLSLVILAAAYAALDQHWRYADAGQRQTERMQVTRALFERMTLDLRSVVFQPDTSVAKTTAFVGDAEKLVLQIDTPGGERSAGPQSVLWEIRELESNRQRESALGLARVVRAAATSQDEPTSPPDLAAAEIQAIHFRYFARGSWFDDWDSFERQELPRAVEITIGFRNVNAAEREADGAAGTGEYRLIVPVPASES